MAGGSPIEGGSYSRVIGFVFIFNIIVGTGALNMPHAFKEAGWIVGVIVVSVLAFVSYITTTFVVESMSVSNGLLKLGHQPASLGERSVEPLFDSSPSLRSMRDMTEATPLFPNEHTQGVSNNNKDVFDITKRMELGEMAGMLFSRVGLFLFYLVMCTYLYGDLAVYAVAVPKSLRDTVCTYSGESNASRFELLQYTTFNLEDSATYEAFDVSKVSNVTTESDPCWASLPSFHRQHAYWVFLTVFVLLLGPFSFFNVSKTKYLQVFTACLRWLAFLLMIVLTLIALASSTSAERPNPALANWAEIPGLFGVCVYAFMCHHSLPGMITPLNTKRGIFRLLFGNYTLVLVFYLILSLTAVFTFQNLSELYTMDFKPHAADASSSASSQVINKAPFLGYFLILFPVFTLSTSFPVITVTLRENLKTLVKNFIVIYSSRNTSSDEYQQLSAQDVTFRPWVDRVVFPLVAVLPPVVLAAIVMDLNELVNITGGIAGAGIQYVIPVCLVYCARRALRGNFHDHLLPQLGVHSSPFQHWAWLMGVLVWTVVSVILVIYHLATRYTS